MKFQEYVTTPSVSLTQIDFSAARELYDMTAFMEHLKTIGEDLFWPEDTDSYLPYSTEESNECLFTDGTSLYYVVDSVWLAEENAEFTGYVKFS